MTVFSEFQAFRQLGPAQRLLLCEAVAALALARILVLALPLRALAPWLSRQASAAAADAGQIAGICRAVTTAARHVPWAALCLPQAIAAKAMLARRGLAASFHLGAGLAADGSLSAHAWLEAGGQIVIGAAGAEAVTPLARFG